MNIRNNVVKTYVESYYREIDNWVFPKYNWLGRKIQDGKYAKQSVYVPARYETTSTLEILDSNGKWVKIPEVVTNVSIEAPCKSCN